MRRLWIVSRSTRQPTAWNSSEGPVGNAKDHLGIRPRSRLTKSPSTARSIIGIKSSSQSPGSEWRGAGLQNLRIKIMIRFPKLPIRTSHWNLEPQLTKFHNPDVSIPPRLLKFWRQIPMRETLELVVTKISCKIRLKRKKKINRVIRVRKKLEFVFGLKILESPHPYLKVYPTIS